MRVEACCQSLLTHFLPLVDPQRQGLCLDVGVGTFAFYCEQFARLGFPTVAVEPLPVPQLKRLAKALSFQLIEACLSDTNGQQTLYQGRFAGFFNSNFSSLSPDWFGASPRATLVPTQTLPTLIQALQPGQITCLKLDIEGWEFNVLKQLPLLPAALRPKVILFEYGGGASKHRDEKGWSQHFFEGTLNCLRVLQACGYQDSLLIDFAPQTQETRFHLPTIETTTDESLLNLFPDHCIYGNIISFLDYPLNAEWVAQLCRPYYRVNPLERLVSQLVSR
ncbi:FkbM family methyltransferase [Synechocystis sp. LKSZ1]|uniref:FkbM family methyltransferase n=1 Tax=Synechocystis sp. LKSZ1 TaxID=3144951 RepID=UPI00336BD204